MDVDDFIGEISETTKRGIVTHVDDRYNYVWSIKLGTLELRFPHNTSVQFELGEIVRYVQSRDGRGVQVVGDLLKYDCQQFNVQRYPNNNNVKWTMEVLVMFAPRDSEFFRTLRAKVDDNSLNAIAYSKDFGLVMSFYSDLHFDDRELYKAKITRYPNAEKNNNNRAKMAGTIFCLASKLLTKVDDPPERNRLMNLTPWQEQEDDIDIGLEPNAFEENNHLNIAGAKKPAPAANVSVYGDEPIASEMVHREKEGMPSLGLVVCAEPEYSVIWSSKHDLVRVQHNGTARKDLTCSPWPLCEWVNYRCFIEESQLNGGVKCNHTAYDTEKASFSREVLLIGRTNVAVRMILKDAKAHSTQFFTAKDDFFSDVLCCFHDKNLKHKMQENDGNTSVEVLAVFTTLYTFSKWVAFAMRVNDQWARIENLPSSVESLVQPFFQTHSSPSISAYSSSQLANGDDGLMRNFNSNLMAANSNGATITSEFKPPSDWNGIKPEGNKFCDVLGVVACSEDNGGTAVIATVFGFARQPTNWPLGTWVRATIVPDEDNNSSGSHLYSLKGLRQYRVLKSKKIRPVMSTRAVTPDPEKGIEKLLICCNIKMGANCLENDFLGKVEDPSGYVKEYSYGYLVEIGLANERGNGTVRYWKVLKNHGQYTPNVDMVALKLSYFHFELGRTCDDAHTILIDSEYEAKGQTQAQTEKAKLPSPLKPVAFPVNNPSPPAAVQQTADRQQCAAPCSSSSSNNAFNNGTMVPPKMAKYVPPLEQDRKYATAKDDCLDHYVPSNGEWKRYLGLVVKKCEKYAILYTKDIGDAIVLSKQAETQEEFDRLFVLGKFVGALFARVTDNGPVGLEYQWMCLPTYKVPKRPPQLQIRIVLGQFVQVYVECDFRKKNILQCTEDLEPDETEKRYFVDTDFGKVLLNNDVVEHNDLLGKIGFLWLTHIKKRFGCWWQIAFTEKSSFKDPAEPIYQLEDLKIKIDRIPGEIAKWSDFLVPQFHSDRRTGAMETVGKDRETTKKRPLSDVLASNGYGDFLYGSHVPDVMSGERYNGQRYRNERRAQVQEKEGNSDSEDLGLEEVERENPYCSDDDEEDDDDEENAESMHSDRYFSDDSLGFERHLRVIAATPPPSDCRRFGEPLPSAAMANGVKKSGKGGPGPVDLISL